MLNKSIGQGGGRSPEADAVVGTGLALAHIRLVAVLLGWARLTARSRHVKSLGTDLAVARRF